MKQRLAGLAALLIALATPLAAQALAARIEGRVGFSLSRELPSGDVLSQSDDLYFNKPMSPDALSSFAIAAQSSDTAWATVSGRVGSGWMRFQSLAQSVVDAVPLDTEARGRGSFTLFATVAETITIDAPGLTGTVGSASLGFWVDGVVAAALDRTLPRSDGEVDGYAALFAEFVANGSTTRASLSLFVGNPEWKGLPPVLGFTDGFLGETLRFTYGTPVDVLFTFLSEGSARAESDGEDDIEGMPAAATLVSDFGSTIGWAGVQDLRDAAGNRVTTFTAISSTGTDFRYRIEPDASGNIPEPTTAWLVAAGLALLGARRGPLLRRT